MLNERDIDLDRAIGKQCCGGSNCFELPQSIQVSNIRTNGIRFERLTCSNANVVQDFLLSDAQKSLEADL